MPIGSITTSMLTEAQFQSEIGSTKWILADGRLASGTDYGALTGVSFIPDLRGVFLRGKNNGKIGGQSNPSGDLALGVYQDDEFQTHNHGGGNHTHTVPNNENLSPEATDWTVGEWGGYNAPISTNVPTSASGAIITSQGGNETRVKNVTINYFIKVNR